MTTPEKKGRGQREASVPGRIVLRLALSVMQQRLAPIPKGRSKHVFKPHGDTRQNDRGRKHDEQCKSEHNSPPQ